MDDKAVRDAVRAWIADVTGVPTIHAYQGGVEPPKPYAVLMRGTNGAVSEHIIEYETTVSPNPNDVLDIEYTAHPVREWFWQFSIDVFGDDGGAILRKVKTAFDVHQYRTKLRPLDLFSVDAIADVTEIIEIGQEYEVRHQCDIEVRGIVRDGLVVDVATQAEPASITPF